VAGTCRTYGEGPWTRANWTPHKSGAEYCLHIYLLHTP